MKKVKEESCDSLFDGKLACIQHKEGYRFSIDAVLLAHFITPHKRDRLLDLGTGCGILPLILLFRHGAETLSCIGVELQRGLAALAQKNFAANGFASAVSVIEGDICNIGVLVKEESFTQIVCNPPFYREESGRVSHNKEAALARHQSCGGLADFLRAARFALVNRGKASFIYPAEQSGEFIATARNEGLEVKRMRHVYSYPGQSARLTLFSCVKNGKAELEVLPPLYIYAEKNGAYSDEVAQMYAPSL